MEDKCLDMILSRNENFGKNFTIGKTRNKKVIANEDIRHAFTYKLGKSPHYVDGGGLCIQMSAQKCEWFVFMKQFIKDNICDIVHSRNITYIHIPQHEDMNAYYHLVNIILKSNNSITDDLKDILILCNNFREIYKYLDSVKDAKRPIKLNNEFGLSAANLRYFYYRVCALGDIRKDVATRFEIFKLQNHTFYPLVVLTDSKFLDDAKLRVELNKNKKVKDLSRINKRKDKFLKYYNGIFQLYTI